MNSGAERSEPRRGSLLYLLDNTPMRDVLRGRLTGRLAFRVLIADAELPDTLADRIQQVVGQTFTSRLNKASLARELIVHSRERLDAGVPVDELLALLADDGRVRRIVRHASAAALLLPRPLGDLVYETVRRTRLWRSEKADVARELFAHFRDGLDAEATPAGLADAFGSAAAAARLIHRAKKRNRSWARRMFVRTSQALGVLLALMLLTYIVLAIRLFSASPHVSRNYLAEINAEMQAVPQDQRAWPIYLQAAEKIRPWPTGSLPAFVPGGPHWNEFEAHAEANREAIALFRAAGEKPRLGAVLSEHYEFEEMLRQRDGRPPRPDHKPDPASAENPLLMSVRLPQLTIIRSAARLLQIDAHIAAREGDPKRALADVHAILGAAGHASDLPFLVSDYASMRQVERAVQVLGALLRDHPDLFRDEQLMGLSHKLAAFGGGGPMRVRIASERAYFADTVQRFYTDDHHDGGRPTSALFALIYDHSSLDRFLFSPLHAALTANRRDLMQKYDDLLSHFESEASVPLWNRRASEAARELGRSLQTAGGARYWLITIMLTDLSPAIHLAELITQERDATLVAVALELHRRRNGSWPASLDELTPQFLPAVPPDRYDGKPIKYRLVNGHPLLYSVGVDRDDDGGRPPTDENSLRRGNRRARSWRSPSDLEPRPDDPTWVPVPDGDWVLWPPVDSSEE